MLQQGARQRELERPRPASFTGIERRDRAHHAVQHPDGGDGPDVEQVRRHGILNLSGEPPTSTVP